MPLVWPNNTVMFPAINLPPMQVCIIKYSYQRGVAGGRPGIQKQLEIFTDIILSYIYNPVSDKERYYLEYILAKQRKHWANANELDPDIIGQVDNIIDINYKAVGHKMFIAYRRIINSVSIN